MLLATVYIGSFSSGLEICECRLFTKRLWYLTHSSMSASSGKETSRFHIELLKLGQKGIIL